MTVCLQSIVYSLSEKQSLENVLQRHSAQNILPGCKHWTSKQTATTKEARNANQLHLCFSEQQQAAIRQ